MITLMLMLQLAHADLLTELDQYLGKSTLAQEYKLGETAQMVHVSCMTASSCDTYKTFQKITKASDAEVEITYVGSNGNVFAINKITAVDWEKHKGNLVRFFIANKESYGIKFTVTSLKESMISVIVHGQKKDFHGYTVELTGTNGMQTAVETTFITNEILGLGQMADRQWKNPFFPQGKEQIYLEAIN